MAITNGYCSLVEFKAYATITSTNAGDDAVLEQIIEGVSRYIDNETGLYFYADAAATKYYTPSMGDMLQVHPLRTVTTLKTDDGDRTYGDSWDPTDYDLMPLNPKDSVYFWIEPTPNGSYSFPVGIKKGVQIVGDFGYAAIPMDIKIICMDIAKSIQGRRSGQGAEAVQITAAGVMITPRDIGPYARKVINEYRRLV